MKTIKRERQVRLDELIKHVWDKGIKDETFHSSHDGSIHINYLGHVVMYDDCFAIDELFTITEEVEITEDTTINLAYRIKTERGWQTFDKNETTINKIINTYKRHPHAYLEFIYLLNPNDSIGELIWSKEKGMVN